MKEYAKSFYLSQSWRSCRESYYKKQNGICERCGSAGDIVHHKIYISPENINNPKITLSFSNLELLCKECHNKEHLKKSKSNLRYSIDESGNVLPPG
jgi:5-methylcytosine-specific restriction endonuclease McrA